MSNQVTGLTIDDVAKLQQRVTELENQLTVTGKNVDLHQRVEILEKDRRHLRSLLAWLWFSGIIGVRINMFLRDIGTGIITSENFSDQSLLFWGATTTLLAIVPAVFIRINLDYPDDRSVFVSRVGWIMTIIGAWVIASNNRWEVYLGGVLIFGFGAILAKVGLGEKGVLSRINTQWQENIGRHLDRLELFFLYSCFAGLLGLFFAPAWDKRVIGLVIMTSSMAIYMLRAYFLTRHR